VVGGGVDAAAGRVRPHRRARRAEPPDRRAVRRRRAGCPVLPRDRGGAAGAGRRAAGSRAGTGPGRLRGRGAGAGRRLPHGVAGRRRVHPPVGLPVVAGVGGVRAGLGRRR
jgi:hypothetical protein